MKKHPLVLQSYGTYLKSGQRPYFGQKILFETQQEYVKAEVVSFVEYFKEYTELTISRTGENWAVVKTDDGRILKHIPFSMIYLQPTVKK